MDLQKRLSAPPRFGGLDLYKSNNWSHLWKGKSVYCPETKLVGSGRGGRVEVSKVRRDYKSSAIPLQWSRVISRMNDLATSIEFQLCRVEELDKNIV